MSDIEKRIAERKAELARIQEEDERITKRLMEAPEIFMLVGEYLCVFGGGIAIITGHPDVACAPLLLAIYVKLKR